MEYLPENSVGQINVDAWENARTGANLLGRDKRMDTVFGSELLLDDQTLSDLYRSEGLGARVIDIHTGDMVRNWFYLEADTDNTMVAYLDDMGAKIAIKEALKWSRVFGGSVVFMGIVDGRPADQPVNTEAIQKISFLEVYDRRDIRWDSADLYKDEREPKFGEPEVYTIRNVSTGRDFRVHESRLLLFKGVIAPKTERALLRGWGDSAFQRMYTRLKGVGGSLDGIEGINDEFILGILKLQGLPQMLSNVEGRSALQNRLLHFDLSKASRNTILVDKNEEYERAPSFGVSGLRDLVDVLIDVLCGISNTPRVKLIGDQSKGLGGDSSGNIRMYYDDRHADQTDELEPELKKLIRLCAVAKNFPDKGIKDFKITFFKLWQPTEKESAETKLLNAKADTLYYTMGLAAEYIIASRFGGRSYGENIVLPEKYVEILRNSDVKELTERIEAIAEKLSSDTKETNEMASNGTDPGQTGKDNPGNE